MGLIPTFRVAFGLDTPIIQLVDKTPGDEPVEPRLARGAHRPVIFCKFAAGISHDYFWSSVIASVAELKLDLMELRGLVRLQEWQGSPTEQFASSVVRR